jgi:4-hydroxy-tetrahydrodipicolinate synthase
MSSRTSFGGCYTAIVTPFTADGGAVDLRRLEEGIRRQAAGGVAGIVPCGTTGESPTLAEEEHAQVVETAVRVGRAAGLRVVAGAGSNSTAHAVHLQKLAFQLGADAGLQVTPYYNKPSQEGIYRHFMAVADSCDLPVMLYNIPGRAGVAIAPETVERLARHPNVVAIKEATGSMDSASEIRQRCGIAVLSGDDSLTPSFAAVGACGVVSVVSNLVPGRVAELCRLLAANDFRGALEVHMALLPLSKGLLSIDVNPVPVKSALASLGLDSGAVRLPLAPASAAAAARIRELVAAAGIAAHAAAHAGAAQ